MDTNFGEAANLAVALYDTSEYHTTYKIDWKGLPVETRRYYILRAKMILNLLHRNKKYG
jgi:hypothetical protein